MCKKRYTFLINVCFWPSYLRHYLFYVATPNPVDLYKRPYYCEAG
jgi:hypothetical protein